MRKAIYRMRDEDETRKAEEQRAATLEHDASFFAVNWDRYDDIPALPLEMILPLSVGINPSHRFAKIELAATYAGQATGAAAEKIAEMLKRRKKLVENLETEGGDIPVAVKGKTNLEHRIKVAEFVAFAQKKGWELPEQLATTGSAANHAEAPETGKPTPRNDGRDTGKREGQIQAIEKAARDLGYSDPLKIPTGGKAAIKAHCIASAFGHSESAFRTAWREANKQVRIRLAEKEKYM